MQKIHIFNPAAGKIKNLPKDIHEQIYQTKCIGDAEKYVYNLCLDNDIHFIVHGGDGTISEVANGIIKAGAGHRSLLSVVPKGTGNDFVKAFDSKNEIHFVDAIKFNDQYCINSLNTGIDLVVVEQSNKFKKLPLISGSLAYILGVICALFKKTNEKWSISLCNQNGENEFFNSQQYSLALFANGNFYGGGFNAAPLASLSDGLIDVILIKKVSIPTLLRLILSYRAGRHFDGNKVAEKFKNYMVYRMCTEIKISGIKKICSDGEIYKTNSANISIIKNALRYI